MMRELKQMGFSDQGIADAIGGATELEVRAFRKAMGVLPVVKQTADGNIQVTHTAMSI